MRSGELESRLVKRPAANDDEADPRLPHIGDQPQAMVSMMLPSALVELLEELEFELPRSAIELSMNDEIID
jgi:hypothetical protein